MSLFRYFGLLISNREASYIKSASVIIPVELERVASRKFSVVLPPYEDV